MSNRLYHVDLPYPHITGLNPNKRQAMLLMSGYSGVSSELTTVTQYAYHKLKCTRIKELYEALQGIFLVETHHLELLGHCINQLGVDPKYNMFLNNQKSISWISDAVNYKSSLNEIILTDIEGEKGAVRYYEDTAKIIENKKIEALLLRLAKDEALHVEIFTELYRKYFR